MPKAKSGDIAKTRCMKVWCENDGYIVRMSRTTILTMGTPICPVCRKSLKEAN